MSYLVTAPLVLAKSQDGRTHHRYHGEIIDWLSDAQRARWLENGMIEEITPAEIAAITDTKERRQRQADEAESERVRRCLDAIEELDLPLHTGRPTMRAALEERGHRFANETISGALKLRREVSRPPGMPAWPEVGRKVTAQN